MTETPRITAALVDFKLNLDEQTEVRLLRADDADALYDTVMRNREHLRPWMTWMDRLIDASDIYAFVRAAEKEAYQHSAFKAGIWHRAMLLGVLDLHDIEWNNGRAALGYWLDRDHTGQGLMTNAVRLFIEYAFEALDLHRIEIRVATQNARSRLLAERLGFTLEGVLRDAQRIRGAYVDHALYALLRDDPAKGL